MRIIRPPPHVVWPDQQGICQGDCVGRADPVPEERDEVKARVSDRAHERDNDGEIVEDGQNGAGVEADVQDWRSQQHREGRELCAAVREDRVFGEETIAKIPRYPSPWLYIPAPEELPPANQSSSFRESAKYHPLVDRPFDDSFLQHSVHRRLWEHLPAPQNQMLETPDGLSLRRVHHNNFKTRRSMGSTSFWLGSLCTTCGRPHHPPASCVSNKNSNPASSVPCHYCRQRHPVAVCMMLHTRCQRCERLGHFPALCQQHTSREWYVYFLRHVHLGLFTGTNKLGPQFGRFGFGATGRGISDNPTVVLLEEMALKKIQGTMTMMSEKRKDYVRKITFVLDPHFLVPEVHVARARLILMLRGIHIRDPEKFKKEVFERLSRLESYQRLQQPWLPLPPNQRPLPEGSENS